MERLTTPKPHVCFQVEKVIGISSDGSYQVQWAPAWVSKFHLVGCEHLIQEFLQQEQTSGKEVVPERPHERPDLFNQSNESNQPDMEMLPFQSDNSGPISEYDEDLTDDHEPDNVPNKEANEQVNDTAGRQDVHPTFEDNFQVGSSCQSQLDGTSNYDEGRLASNPANNDSTQLIISVKNEDEEDLIDTTESFSHPNTSHFSNSSSEVRDTRASHSSGSIEVQQEENRGTLDFVENYTTLLHGAASSKYKYVCSVCHKVYSDSTLFSRHLLVHNKEKPHVCNICDRQFSQSNNLKRHILTHTKEKRFACELCGNCFTRKTSLDAHILIHKRDVHPGSRLYNCEGCGKTFSQAVQLYKHKVHCSTESLYTSS